MVELAPHQVKAVKAMHNGCILRADVGSGKSRTALAYYYERVCCGGLGIDALDFGKYGFSNPKDLYIITTAKKRDDFSWFDECIHFGLTSNKELNESNVSVVVDSWNNIKKYTEVKNAFFIFDEQRLVGSGAWVKAFYKIAKNNEWIILSATPGDTWSDYIPVFVANGYYKNKTEFNNIHAVYDPFCTKFPKIKDYINQGRLISYRNKVLVNMEDERTTEEHHIDCTVDYDKEKYRRIKRDRWDIYDDCPIEETGKLCYLERKVSNSDPSRISKLTQLVAENDKTIIFYNHDYELEIIRNVLTSLDVPFAEWNGKNHQQLPEGDRWAYVVQYAAGCEAWNCITTNVIIFYSQNYSYKVMKQASGRINRMNTPFHDLYYYHIRSYSPIDLAIKRALSMKKDFNERSYAQKR